MSSKYLYLSVIVFVSALVGCSRDYLDDLGGGYTLARTNKYNHRITKGHTIYVDTNVTEFLLVGRYIFGYRDKPVWTDIDEELVSKNYGFFIFDKKTASLEEGMSEMDFFLRIKQLGIDRNKVFRERFEKTY